MKKYLILPVFCALFGLANMNANGDTPINAVQQNQKDRKKMAKAIEKHQKKLKKRPDGYKRAIALFNQWKRQGKNHLYLV